MKADRIVHPVEGLESRRLLSVGPSLEDGLLRVKGESKLANEIVVQLDAADATKLNVTFNGATTTYNVADVTGIKLMGGKREDRLEISEANGAIAISARLQGKGGNDTLIGGSGNDDIKGDQGDDVITGGAGDDRIRGLAGKDAITGDDGNDSIAGGVGDDTISGGLGDDLLKGFNGKDSISGDEGNDTIDGGSGDDAVLGGDGVDSIKANSGHDNVSGGAGADILKLNKKAQNEADPEDVLI